MTRGVVVCVAALVSGACGSSSRRLTDAGTQAADAGADAGRVRDAEADGPAELRLDAAIDAEARDAEAQDAAADADPNVYPCDSEGDCTHWWRGLLASCTNGYCCQGEVVGDKCMCGVREGTCPPHLYCCRSDDSPDADVCTFRCYYPPGQ